MINIIKNIFNESNFENINLNEYNKFDFYNYRKDKLKYIDKINICKNIERINTNYRVRKYIKNVDLFIPNEVNKKFEYFVVVSLVKPNILDLDKLILEDFNYIYTYIKNSKYYNSYMDKNTSLIITFELDILEGAMNNSELHKKIFDIEENKYNFKKYVITYNVNQVNELSKEIDKNNSTLEYINKVVYSKDEFAKFKSNPNKDTVYNLVSKLYIKIPFLKLNYKEETMDSLKPKLDMELKLSGNYELVSKIINIEDIDKIDESDIMYIIEGLG